MTTGSGRDDAQLLREHVAGDPGAFDELVRRHRDRLWAVALRTTGDADEAADALQDGLISAFRRAETFRGDAAVTTWLHRIVVNACLDRLRRRAARRTESLPTDEDHALQLADSNETDTVAEARERHVDVLTALSRLGADQRAALVLVDMEGYSVDEAALILGCAPGTVKSRCSRGRANLVPLLASYSSDADARQQPVGRSRTGHGRGNHRKPGGVPPTTASPSTAEPPSPLPGTRGGVQS